jgi:hypothetical protein
MVIVPLFAASPGNAPALPLIGARIVNISTEAQLQSAMGNLRSGDTLLLATGIYNLSSSLFINGKNDITIRGAAGSANVVLAGKGMDNANHGGVPFGIWSNGTNTTIAHLTIRETYDNPIIFNPGAQSPHVYCVRLINAGSQFIKSNPTDVNAGSGVANGIVEYCWFEYTGNPPSDHGSGVGYFNGISAHAAKNWIVRGNLFKNLHNPDGSAYPWNPSVLFWRHSVGTITEQNTFVNVDRAVAYGLDNGTPYFDHAGGVVRNNFIYLAPGFLSATRKAGSDGSIIAWNSPGTQVDHNTALLNGNEFYAVEFRFASTTNCTARNNLSDAPIHLRDTAVAAQSGNLLNADSGMFVNAAAADLHLTPSATNAIDKAANLTIVTNDFDGDLRPSGSRSDVGADELVNSAPQIKKLSLSGNDCLIDFTTLAGFSYELVKSSDLTTGAWPTAVSNIPGNGSVVQATDTNGAGQPNRFYKIRRSL